MSALLCEVQGSPSTNLAVSQSLTATSNLDCAAKVLAYLATRSNLGRYMAKYDSTDSSCVAQYQMFLQPTFTASVTAYNYLPGACPTVPVGVVATPVQLYGTDDAICES